MKFPEFSSSNPCRNSSYSSNKTRLLSKRNTSFKSDFIIRYKFYISRNIHNEDKHMLGKYLKTAKYTQIWWLIEIDACYCNSKCLEVFGKQCAVKFAKHCTIKFNFLGFRWKEPYWKHYSCNTFYIFWL